MRLRGLRWFWAELLKPMQGHQREDANAINLVLRDNVIQAGTADSRIINLLLVKARAREPA